MQAKCTGFGLAEIKEEGTISFWDYTGFHTLPKDQYEQLYGKLVEPSTTYIEREVPIKYVDQINLLIDHFLAENK